MAESVSKAKTKDVMLAIDFVDKIEEIKKLYLSDDRPWIIGFSGGKDSTCMTQLVWTAISQLPAEKLHKKIYIIGCDTLVESPKIVERLKSSLSNMQAKAEEQNVPIQTNMVKPEIGRASCRERV